MILLKKGDLVVSNDNSKMFSFVECFNDVERNISKEEALENFSQYKNKIYAKMKGM